MDDAVSITHNPQADTDRPMDSDTGRPLAPSAADTTVYTGKADIVPLFGNLTEEGANPLEVDAYSLRIPLSATAPEVGDDVTITACRRDPNVVDKAMTVARVVFTSFPSSRQLIVEERAPARARAG
jgi:hypothetical protein